METFVKEYLLEKGIKSEEQLAVHIIELKRNTVVPDVMFELVDLLVNNKDCLLSFFAENKIREDLRKYDKYFLGKNLTNIILEESMMFPYSKEAHQEWQDHWTQTMTGERSAINEKRKEKVKTVLDDMLGKEDKGVKHNNGKPQISLLFKQFPKALEAIAKCSEYGHEKYKEADQDYLNYQRVEGGSKAYADAGLRHRLFKEGTTDLDSQLPHSYHTCWNALAELELLLMKR